MTKCDVRFSVCSIAQAILGQPSLILFSREEKEAWIRAKYEQKEYLADRPHRNVPLNHVSCLFYFQSPF